MALSNERFQVRLFPTPIPTDVLFYEVVDGRIPKNERPVYGTPHWDPIRWPHHRLVYVEPIPADQRGQSDGSQRWYYAADRDNQDLYNWQWTDADIGGTKFKAVMRVYVTPRATFNAAAPTMGTAMPNVPASKFAGAYVLAERQQRFAKEEELNSTFVMDVHTYVQKVTLTNIKIDQEDGLVTYEKTTLYYRGEEVGGTAVEALFDDVDNAFWAPGDNGYGRRGEQLSDNWFAVVEYEAIKLTLDNEISVDKMLPDKFFCPQSTTTTTTSEFLTAEEAAEPLETPEPEVGERVIISRRGRRLITKTVHQDGTLAPLKGSSIDERTGNTYVETQELVPVDEVEESTVDATGNIVLYSPYDACYSIKVTRKIASTAARTWTSIINYEWPPVLRSIRFVKWPRRDGRLDEVHVDVNVKEGYAGPQKVTVTQWWQKDPYEPTPPPPMIPSGFSYSCPLFNIRVGPCLHPPVNFYASTGTVDPTYKFATDDFTVAATVPDDWPPSLTWSESKPYNGGYLVTTWLLYAPSV